ncbi:MAG: hypothetical protein WBS54_03775 [Acidobacteriota bacterium]
MKRSRLITALVAFIVSFPATAITVQQVITLLAQFQPPAVTRHFSGSSNPLEDPLLDLNRQGTTFTEGSQYQYLSLSFPEDPKQYLLLGWSLGFPSERSLGAFYWRLLSSTDGGQTWAIYQDAPTWFGPLNANTWDLRAQDLTGDGIPEVLVEGGDVGDAPSLIIFAWRGGQLVNITPEDPRVTAARQAGLPIMGVEQQGDLFTSAFQTDSDIEIQDLDGDGIAEVVVGPWLQEHVNAPNDITYTPSTPTRIWKFNGTSYVLWKEVPPTDPYPTTVPSIAVVHPGTIPLSELQGGGGNGNLQVFVSHPSGTETVDDMNTAGFTFQGTPLAFQKRWPNQKQPDRSYANNDWMGCPMRQEPAQSQGDWNPSPEDPFVPSPDGTTEYHFVGPYLELRLPKSVVYPMLLQQATDAFTKDPSRQTYFIDIPISGKITNGKLAAIATMVCIKNTGASAKATKETVKPSPAVSPAPPAGEKPKK